MIEVTYDPDARTLYAYFVSIDEGQDAEQLERNGFFLLDKNGQILGVHIDLGEVHPRLLHFVLEHDEVHFDQRGASLRLMFVEDQPSAHADFAYPAIFDLDRANHALGVEFIADPEFNLESRLRYVQPYIVETFGSDDDEDDDGGDTSDSPVAQPSQTSSDADETADHATDEAPTASSGEQAADTPYLSDETIQSGFVALVGKPNVGKSTLLNAYFSTKVSIVSPKPQTTRIAVRGILNRDDAQVVFIDTPGIHQPRSRLGEYMVESARRAIPDADVVCLIVDASVPPDAQDRRIAQLVKRSHKPSILVLNKIDIARHADVVLPQYRELGPWDSEVALSAKKQDGIEALLSEIVTRLPAGPRLFPVDQLTDLPEREHIAELIREKVLLNTDQEVPHGVAIEIEEWEPRGERLYIRATVNVEREGHKAIIIGENGQKLKKIGSAARFEIERALNRSIYLDLWIKVRKDWRRDATSLRWLGYDIRNLG